MAIAANGSKAAAEKPGRRLRIPLSLKFATVTVALALLLLALGSAAGLWWAYNGVERTALAAQRQKAEILAGRIEGALSELQSQIAWTARPAWKSTGAEQQRADFTRMLQQFPAVTELFYIDSNGLEQLKVSRLAPDSVASRTNHANEPRFTETVRAKTWFGPVYVRNGAELSTTVGVAHADGGVTVAEIDLAFVAGLVGAAGQEDGLAFVVDPTGRLIAHPAKNPIAGDVDLSALPQVAAALAAPGSGTTTDAVTDDGAAALAAYVEVPGAGWRVLAQTPKGAALAPFYTLAGQSALLSAAGLLIAAAIGIWMARRVAVPIRRLQAGAEQLGEGDLTQRVAVSRRDEIGMLADRFNTMAARLQQNKAGLEAKVDDRTEGLDIAQQQQVLTVDMLRTISRTGYQLEAVLDTLIGSAVRLTEANVGAVWLREGDAFRLAAQLGHTRDWVEAARKAPFTAGSETHAMAAAAAYSGQIINVDDVLRDVRFAGDYGERPAYSDERSALALPLKHDGKVEAVFALSRADPIAFTDRQAALAQDFADQALIAVRHMKLLGEIETRDRRLARASDEQAATGHILRAISKLPADTKPVLDAIAQNAARFCDAPYCHIDLFDGQLLHVRAAQGLPPEAMELIAGSFPAAPAAGSPAGQAMARRESVLVADLQAETELMSDALSRLLGVRSMVAIPLLNGGAALGVMTVADTRPDAVTAPLKGRRLALLEAFADQAVIALEGARLSDELATRTSDFAASLDREAATGGLLQAVSRTDYNLDGVLARLGRRAVRECAAVDARFFRFDGDALLDAHGKEAAAEGHAGLARRVVATAAAVNMPDAWQDPEHVGKDPATRSMLGLPLLAKGKIVGAMTLARGQVMPFDDEQAELAAALADQAALAIAGAQLPAELAQRTAERDEWRQRHAVDTEAAERRRVTEMDEAVRSHAAEMEDIRRRHEVELAEIRRLHAEELAERTAERDESRHLHVSDVEAAERRRATEMEETLQGHAAELAEIRQRHAAEIGDILQRHADELAERTAERDEWHHRHTADVEAAEQQRMAELDEARRLHAEEAEAARQRHQAELAETQRHHAGELQETIGAHSAKLAETIDAHARQLDETRHLHAAELSEARRLHAEDVETARFQRIATAEALKRVADPSPGLDAVLQTIAGLAARACGAGAAVLFRQAGDRIEAAAVSGLPAENLAATLAGLRDAFAARAIAEGRTLHTADRPAGEAAFGAALAVPLLKDGAPQGALVLLRAETEPFGEERAALAESFADQAAIAIETERLLQLAALRAGQLEEARRFREAAARVLDLVGRVQADPKQALDAVVAAAAELCQADSAEINLAEGEVLRLVAAAGAMSGDFSAARPAIAEGRTVHVVNDAGDGAMPGAALAVPLMLDGKAAGSLALRRENAFSDREIELAGTLAAQAAIAIARARLAVALEERGQSLRRALSEREATAGMLATIGRSRFDLGAVLDTLAHSAAGLCGAGMAAICLDDGATLESVGSVGFPRGWPGDARHLQAAGLARRAIREAVPLQSTGASAASTAAGHTLAVPLASDRGAIGALVIVRETPFGDEDISVAATLADQASIALESVRLLGEVEARTAELGEALRQQAAIAGTLRSIKEADFDLTGVLTAMADRAASLCGAATARIYLGDGDELRLAAGAGVTAGQRAYEEAKPLRADANSPVGRAAIGMAAVHVPDFAGGADRTMPDAERFGAAAAMLCVPLLRDGAAIGVFVLTRLAPGPFAGPQIGLVEALADQAVIAIETVRLADEVEARTAEVGEGLRQQTAIADMLRTISRPAFDLDGVLTTLTASAATLCSAGGAAIYLLKDDAYRVGAATGAMPSQLARAHPPGRDNWIGRAALDGATIHVADAGSDAAHPGIAGISGLGAILCVPLQREGAVVGVFALVRPEPGAFTERQIGLVRTFADQAVIAMETLRLAEAAQASADELSEALRDLHAAQQRLGGMERLASLGQLTAGIAHEIRSSLDSVKDFSAVSNRLVDDIRMVLEGAVIDGGTRAEVEELGDTLKDNLNKVVEFGKRADSVVVNMLHIDENQSAGQDTAPGGHRPVDINAVVDESLGIAYHSARAERRDFDVRLEKTFDPAAGKVDLYPQEITRALLHLISNGIQATARRGAETNGAAYQPVLVASTKNLGDAVEVRIRDNGAGILPEVKARMFNPFFTTKPSGEGTGLGLSLSRDIIVKQHAGTIDVETEPGSFTEFRIVLPRGGAALAKREA